MTGKPLLRITVFNWNWKLFTILLFLEFMLQVVAQRNTFTSPGPLIKCSDFSDNRTNPVNGSNFVNIPEHMTSRGIYSPQLGNYIKFPFSPYKTFNCTQEQVIQKVLNYKNMSMSASPRNFTSVLNGTVDPPKGSYFTSSSYFFDAETQYFYRPNGEYCVSSISMEEMVLNLCANEENCNTATSTNKYCLPKCCAIDEVLYLPTKSCIPVISLAGESFWHNNDTVFSGVSPWHPPIYTGNQNITPTLWTEPIVQHWPSTPTQESRFISPTGTFRMASFPKTCNAKDLSESYFKWGVNEKANSKEILKVEYNLVRLELPESDQNGTVIPMFYDSAEGHWLKKEKLDFCVDGYFENKNLPHGERYINNDYNYVVVYCEHTNSNEKSGSSITQISVASLGIFFVVVIFTHWLN